MALGSALAIALIQSLASVPTTMHLHGELGAGKSTLARALLRGLGVKGKIKSPTYALVEPYESAYGSLLHMDLYRLTEAAELEYLGLDSLFGHASLMLIEWPEKAGTLLPAPDLNISLSHYKETNLVGRQLQIVGVSMSGNLLLTKLAAFF